MSFWKYCNPLWEPHFNDISPFWSKVYFSTNIGPVRYFAATFIFKKLSRLEERDGANGS